MFGTTEKFFSCLVLAAGSVGCGSDGAVTVPVSRADVVKTYSENLTQGYSDSVDDENVFKGFVATFLDNPTEATLADARTSWLASRAHYMLTEGARFYDGPIDIDTPDRPSREGLINSWPLDEAYIDYTTDAKGKVDETV